MCRGVKEVLAIPFVELVIDKHIATFCVQRPVGFYSKLTSRNGWSARTVQPITVRLVAARNAFITSHVLNNFKVIRLASTFDRDRSHSDQTPCPAIGYRHSVWSKLTKYQKHTFAHTNLRGMQLIVLIYLFIAISIENPRVGGSIPPPGTTPYS